MPLDVTAWFSDNLSVTGNPDSVLYNQTNLFGGYMIDFITFGRQNLAPTAAAGILSGRARTVKGNGISYVTLVLSGGNLLEPIYTTTNQFGNYQFTDIPVGESYVLQVMSGRYTFQKSKRVINFDDSITDQDFIVDEPNEITNRGDNNNKGEVYNQLDSRKRP